MAGFPTRSSRTAFGPKRANRRPVVNPLHEIGQEHYNLAFAQIAGMNMVTPIAWALMAANGAILAHAEAWDPDRKTAGPTSTRTGAGTYKLTYATSYPDQDGQDVTIGFYGANVSPQTSGSPSLIGNGAANPASPNEVLVRIATHADVATDYSFMVWIY